MEHLPLHSAVRHAEKRTLCSPLIRHIRDSFRFKEQEAILRDFCMNLNAGTAESDKIHPLLQGFDLSSWDTGSDEIESHSKFLESAVKSMLWFGAIQEFETACGLPLDWDGIKSYGEDFSTVWLPEYARSVVVQQILQENLPIAAENGDQLVVKNVESIPDSTLFYLEDRISPVEFSLRTGAKTIVLPVGFLRYLHSSRQATTHENIIKLTRTVCSSSLCRQLGYSRNYVTWEGSEAQAQAANSLARIQSYAQKAWTQEKQILQFENAVAIDILCESLGVALDNIFNQKPHQKGPSFIGDDYDKIMLRKHWCPARTAKLLTTASTTIRYILTTLKSYDDRNHSSCSATECKLSPTENHLVTRHHTSCLIKCEWVTFYQAHLISVLKKNGIPAIQQTLSTEGTYQYSVCDARHEEMIAVSHVWAHGLGNRMENALPKCQIEMLFDRIRQLPSRTGQDAVLWIDTLCIPIDHAYKRVAITKLSDVYSMAAKVLVIDRYLTQVGEDWLEQRLQLLCSEWQRRLWTLQEGRLGQNVFIQFQNSAIPTSSLMDVEIDGQDGESEVLHNLRQNTGLWLTDSFSRSDETRQRFLDLLQDLAFRATTVASDEALCIAVLLGLPLEKYTAKPSMADLLRDVVQLPRNLMFLPGQRLKEPGLRWAPASILGHGTIVPFNASGDDVTLLSPNGLVVVMECLRLKSRTTFYRDPPSASELYVFEENGNDTFVFRFTSDQDVPERLVLDQPVILLQNDGRYLRNACTGILVSGEGVYTIAPERGLEDIKLADGSPLPRTFQKCSFRFHVHVDRMNEYTIPRFETMAKRRERVHHVSGMHQRVQMFCVD